MFYPLLLRDNERLAPGDGVVERADVPHGHDPDAPPGAGASNGPASLGGGREVPGKPGLLSKSFGVVGAVVGVASVFCSRSPPARRGSRQKVDYFTNYISTDRVAFAFCVDLALCVAPLSQSEKQEGLRPDPPSLCPSSASPSGSRPARGLSSSTRTKGPNIRFTVGSL